MAVDRRSVVLCRRAGDVRCAGFVILAPCRLRVRVHRRRSRLQARGTAPVAGAGDFRDPLGSHRRRPRSPRVVPLRRRTHLPSNSPSLARPSHWRSLSGSRRPLTRARRITRRRIRPRRYTSMAVDLSVCVAAAAQRPTLCRTRRLPSRTRFRRTGRRSAVWRTGRRPGGARSAGRRSPATRGTRHVRNCPACGGCLNKDVTCPHCRTRRVWTGQRGCVCHGCGKAVERPE